MMLSRKDETPSEIQTAYFETHGSEFNFMEGHFTDWHGSKYYAGCIYAEKLRNRLPDEKITAIESNDAPEKARKYLNGRIIIENELITMR